jgi:hypothetical protein
MTDIEKARQLFRDAGLAFPTIPEELAAQLREQGDKRLPMRNNISALQPPTGCPSSTSSSSPTPIVSAKSFRLASSPSHGAKSYASVFQ